MKQHDLPGLLSSRICHDLVSPVGAVQNGIDLLAEIAPPGLEEELTLIRQSSGRAADLLKFYRVAFGAADPDSSVGLAALRAEAEAVVSSTRTRWSWTGTEAGALPRPAARLAAIMILCARSATQMGGEVDVAIGADGSLRIALNAARLGLSVGQAALLEGAAPPEEPGPRDIEFALLRPWAQAAGYRMQVSQGPNGLCIEALPVSQPGIAAATG